MMHLALFSVAFLFFAIFASESEAGRFRFSVLPAFGGGETIDLVYDLPDTEPFLRNGEAYDLGYLNSEKNSGYVLYRGEWYSKLTDADIARLKAKLGFDPTTKDRMERAARGSNASWTLAIVLAVVVGGIFVLVHKTMQIVRWLGRLSTTSFVKASKAQDEEEPLAPLEARRARLAKRNQGDAPAEPVSRGLKDRGPAPEEPLPARTGTPARAFGRRNA